MRKAIISVLSLLTGTVAGAGVVGRKMEKLLTKSNAMSDKHLALFLMMNQWVKVKQEGKNLAEYFVKNGYKKIAIYGMSYAGETLIDELDGADIEIAYGIDKNVDNIYLDINVMTMDNELENVDAIVVTAITFFDEIEEKLRDKINCPIVSLEDILYEV